MYPVISNGKHVQDCVCVLCKMSIRISLAGMYVQRYGAYYKNTFPPEWCVMCDYVFL